MRFDILTLFPAIFDGYLSQSVLKKAIDAGETDKAKGLLSDTFSLIDKMAGKGIIHGNAADRYKSRLAKRSSR